MAENEAPEVSEFCRPTNVPTSLPAIHFIGGQILEPQIDPTSGTPSSCGLTIDLVGTLQAALAPFQPLFTILDTVATIAQCFLLLTEVVSNPFKIPDLLACIPGLISKINELLALVPIFPQGIVQMITFVVDVIRFIGQQIDCIVQILESIEGSFEELGRILDRIQNTDDENLVEQLQELYDCNSEEAQQQVGLAIGALGPIARILCTIRSLLALTGDEGKKIAEDYLTFPDPSNVEALSDAITVLRTVKDILLTTVDIITAIAAPFGGIFPPPEVGFTCPLDSSSDDDEEEEEVVLVPTIVEIYDSDGITPLATITKTSPGSPDYPVFLDGTNYSENSKVFWGTSPIPDDNLQLSGETRIRAVLPETLLRNEGKFLISVVNEPESGASPFSGLSETPGGEADNGVEVSEPFEVEVQ